MLRSMRALLGYRVRAADSMAGVARDFLFDDDRWIVRYLVVDTGALVFSGKRVLVPSCFLGRPEWEAGVFPVSLTAGQLTGRDVRGTKKPPAPARELEPHGARTRRSPGAPDGAGGPGRPAGATSKVTGARTGGDPPPGGGARLEENLADMGLRSAREVAGYRMDAVDGRAGRMQDFIVEDADWAIRYVVVDTGRWFPGKKVLVMPLWIEGMTWAGRSARVGLHRTVIASSPEYRPSEPVNREREVRLYDYYGRPISWG